ncbi:MAG: TRAP transporter large permease [Hyphomicrobiaceae bacterium]
MSLTAIGLLGLAGLFFLIFLRVPIGIALAIAGSVGYFAIEGLTTTLFQLGSIPFGTAYNYDLSVIVLFVFMGNLALASGMSRDLYDMARALVGHWRGGLASATIVGCAGFAAVSGSSLASAATMGRVSLPEMERYNYAPSLATGCVAAGGTLGILIPPSTGFIVYAILTEESIGRLFLAGVLPGILLTVLFMITISIITTFNPAAGPAVQRKTTVEQLQTVWRSSALLFVISVVIGGIYLGWFTPVEAASVGAFLTLLLAIARRRLDWETFQDCVLQSIKTFAMVFMILIGAFIFNPFLALTGIPQSLAESIKALELSPLMLICLITVGYIILGTFLEGFAILVLTISIVFPMVVEAGFDPIWFGVLIVVVLEMGLISPPLGLNVFVVKGITNVPMAQIFKGIIPFWIAMIVCAGLLIAFPDIALLLPQTMIR